MMLLIASVGIGGPVAHAASFTVNSTADTADSNPGNGVCDGGGTCTLRAAIDEVNALGGIGHSISFSIPGPAPHTIGVGTGLPWVTAGVDIDATSEPTYSGTPLIILNWTGGAAVADGLHIAGTGITVQGFVVQNFTDEGIEVVGNGNTIRGNFVGVTNDGLAAAGNDDGILVRGDNNTIGGADAAHRNVVGGNSDDGISLDGGDNNTVRGNYVGITANGLGTVGNAGEGIAVQFGANDNLLRGNVISGNTGAGILLRSSQSGTEIRGNTIGLNAAGSSGLPNNGDGVLITIENGGVPTNTLIHFDNVISGNLGNGIALDSGADGTVITRNRIGTNSSGTAAIPNLGAGVVSDAVGLVVGGSGGADGNVISGNGGHGVTLLAGATDAVIEGNYIGLGADGSTAIGNGGTGIYADGDRALIEDNVVSANGVDGIRLEKVDQIARGNLVGTDAGGTLNRGNSGDGVDTGSGTTGSQIGGIAAGDGNTIAFNGENGIMLRHHVGTNGAILGNSIHSNGALGINLRPTAELPSVNTVTLNDVGDSDTDPPNDLINYPVITSAVETLGTVNVDFTVDIQFDVTGVDAWYRIEFFTNSAGADSSGFGEGQTFVASTVVVEVAGPSTTTGSVSFPGSVGDVITATTTHCTTSSCVAFDRTSEFSAAATVVSGSNNPPVLNPIGPQSGNELTNINFTVSATDPDSDGISFEATGLPAGATFVGNAFDWTPSEAQGPGTYFVTITARDNGVPQLTDSEIVTVTVNEVNLGPSLDPVGDRNATEGVLLGFVVTASDPDVPANTLTFSLLGEPVGASITAGGVFSFTPSESQGGNAYTFDVVVSDGGSPLGTDSETITVTVAEGNTAPVLDPVGDQSVDEGSLLSFTATASDSDVPADGLVFSLAGAVPAAASMTSGGDFSWTPGEADGPGGYTFDVVVTDDGTPNRSHSETITVTVNEVNLAPVLPAIGNQNVDENSLLSFSAAAFDPDIPATGLAYSLSGAPSGAVINPSSGAFFWIPSEGQGPGSYTFDITVVDGGTPSLGDSTTVTVTVFEVNSDPIVLSPGNQTGNEGDVVSLSVVASDPDIPSGTLSFTASGLPAGLAMDPATGEITGTLARPAHITTLFPVTVTVTDGVGGSGVASFTWSVVPTNLFPTAVGDSYSINERETLTVSAPGVIGNDSDPEDQTLSVSLVVGPAHGDLLLAADGSFTYTHTGLTDADDSFTYRLADGFGGFDTAVVRIEVILVNRLPIARADTVTLDEDTEAVFDPLANDSDPDGDPLAIDAIEQPGFGDLRIDTAGLRFIPPPNVFGTTTASYTVSDGKGGTASALITFTVSPVNDAPTAIDDSVTLSDYLAATIPVLLNDTDPDGDRLTIASVLGSGIGEINVDGDSVVFRPPSEWVGTTVITYTVVDAEGASDTAELTVTVGEQTLATARLLIGDIESGTEDLASLAPSTGAGLVSLNPVESISLMVNAFYQTISAFQLPFIFLGLSMLVLVGLGGATKVPLLLAGRVRNHWSVVLLDRENALHVHEEPDDSTPVIYNFNPTTESVLSTGKPKIVEDKEWMPVHTPRGGGWVHALHLTEQVDVEQFAKDSRPPKLARDFAERLRSGADVSSLIAERGVVLALTGPPTRLAQQQFTELLEGGRLRMLPTVGGVLHGQEHFRIAVAEPFLAAFDATDEVSAQTAHSQAALIPAEVWNFRYLALGEGTPQPWLVFFEYDSGTPRIVGLGIDE